MTQTINVTDAVKLIKNGDAILIDVREADEFKSEHIAYAMSVPLSSLEGGFKTLDIPPSTTILFQCLKGTRGQMACERIQGLGTCQNQIINIEGGLDSWKEHGFPVIGAASNSPQISIFRQVQIIAGFLIVLLVLIGFTGITITFILAGIIGGALFFAGLTGWCGLAMILTKMPWNK